MAVLKIVIERDADKALARIPLNVAELIEAKIETLARDRNALRNNVTRLVGSDQSRLRVGDWRILFRIEEDVLRIIEVKPRGRAYE